MKRVLVTVSLMALLLLMGCREEKEVKTVQWYRDNPAECQKQVEICKNNPGQLKDDPNCINAMQAAIIDSGGSASEKPRIR